VGFNARGWVGMLVAVLFCGNPAAGLAGDQDSQITVLMINTAAVREPVLRNAETSAARIFRAAGIDIVWVNCGAREEAVDEECGQVLSSNEFVVHIVPSGRTSSDLVFGVAFLGEDGKGKYANIFFDRVQEAHRELGAEISGLVGMVAAHELGHLLLGFHAHSCAGIMTAVWKESVVSQMQMGSLWFTHEQALRMRARIDEGRRMLVRLRDVDGKTPSGQPPAERRYVYGRYVCGATFEGIQPSGACGLLAAEDGASLRRLR